VDRLRVEINREDCFSVGNSLGANRLGVEDRDIGGEGDAGGDRELGTTRGYSDFIFWTTSWVAGLASGLSAQ
jgi:hypothetical protein